VSKIGQYGISLDDLEQQMRAASQEYGIDFNATLNAAARWFGHRRTPVTRLTDDDVRRLMDDDYTGDGR